MSFVVTEPLTEGVVVFHTTLGDLMVELWKRECPKATRNFVQLCLEGHYDGSKFGRVVPGFMAQVTCSDDCVFDDGDFPIETNQRLKFNRRGLMAMAASPETGTNMSQFFFTLDAIPELQNKHTLFGRISGDSLFNLLKLNELELEPGSSDTPTYAPVIKSVEVRVDPFEHSNDPIRPRITAQERKEQERAKREMRAERAKQKSQGKRKGTKNKSLISFGDEAAEEETAAFALPKSKFKSAHDAGNDARLSAKVIDDRGFSAELPPELMGPPPAKRVKGEEKEERREEKRSRTDAPEPSTSKLDEARKLKQKTAEKSEAERRKEEIAKVQAELKKMSSKPSESDDPFSSSKKAKRTGPSRLQLEREKYLFSSSASSSSKASRGKRKANDEDDVLSVLEGFRSKLFEASKAAPKEDEDERMVEDGGEKREKLHGIDLNDDELDDGDAGWLTHSLKFRKDATLDQHSIDEYAVVDPLAKKDKTVTLEEMKNRGDAQKRKYAGEREERGGGRGEGRREDRYEGGGGGGGRREERYGGGGGRRDDRERDRGERFGGRERPEVKNDWRSQRVSDLA
ncbi:hypothetical protein JCM8547_000868 [Rhodosporidiobolus lusitaniae]